MSYTTEYLFDATNIEGLSHSSKEMEQLLQTSFDEAKEFLQYMQATDLWVGQLKEEFTAYLHLVVQYHGWLVGKPVPFSGKVASIQPEANCCEEINKAWNDLCANMAAFTANSDAYAKLEEVT